MISRRLKILLILLYASVSVFNEGCTKPGECRCVKSNGQQIMQHRSIGCFNEIILKDNINLTLKQDTVDELLLSVPENLANFVKTEVKDSVLYIYNDNKCNWLRSFKIDISASVKTTGLKNLECHGSGNVKTEGFIERDYFEINLYDASGRFDMMLKTKVSEVKLHTGPADLHISGYADKSTVYNAGTGFIFMQNYDTKTTDIRHNGSGQCYVNATENLYATLEYVGDINYWGNPAHEYFVNKGEGKIIKH